jgi:hypothetical protein
MGRSCRGALVAIALLVSVGLPKTADAVDPACFDAYEQTQRLRIDGKLAEARDQAWICARDACPAVLREDCFRWHTELVRLETDDRRNVKSVDGGADDSSRVDGSASSSPPRRRGIPTVSLALGGVAAVGLVSFLSFAIAGRVEQGCSPLCQPGQISTLRVEYAVADVSWITGLVALGGAVVFWVAQPSALPADVLPAKTARLRFEARPERSGATLLLRGSF